MKTQKTSSKRSAGPKSSSTKSLTDMDSPAVALAMYRFWLRMCQLSSPDKLKGNLIYLEKAHKENIRLCRQARAK
jgi:hypothetical protein